MITLTIPPMLAAAMSRGALRLLWDGRRVSAARLNWDDVAPMLELGEAFFKWPAVDGIESLSLAAGPLFLGSAPFAERARSLRALRFTGSLESFDPTWLSRHAPSLVRLDVLDLTLTPGLIAFDELEDLHLHNLKDPLETYGSMRCPRVSKLSTWLSPALGVAEAVAALRASPGVSSLRTSVEDRAHAMLVARVLAELGTSLTTWHVEYCGTIAAPDEAEILLEALSREGVRQPPSVDVTPRYLSLESEAGYPTGQDVVYECVSCDCIVWALPPEGARKQCSCGNIRLDVPGEGRVTVLEPRRMKAVRREPVRAWCDHLELPAR